ncbi:hypothetical protein, partial [Bradyrhizobium sp. SZCCHNR31032]
SFSGAAPPFKPGRAALRKSRGPPSLRHFNLALTVEPRYFPERCTDQGVENSLDSVRNRLYRHLVVAAYGSAVITVREIGHGDD